MSRKSALLVAILLVTTTFGGAATSLAATETDAEPVQSPPAEVVRQTQTTNTTVTFENQTTDGTTVTISQVNLTDGGFVVVHDQGLLNGSVLDSVVGVSEYLEPGVSENVTVTLEEPISESQRLLALAYRDTNDNQTFDFVDSQGETDGPYTSDNQVVAADAFVTVEGAETTTTETTTAETTTTTPIETTTETTAIETTTEAPTETTTETTTTETPTETTTTETTTTETTTTELPTTTEEIPPTTATPTETTTETPTETTTATTTTTTTATTTEATTTTETTTTAETTTTTAETTTTEAPTETTTTREPVAQETLTFRIDNVHVNQLSFVVGDSAEPDRTVTVENVSISDRTVRIDLTELLSGESLSASLGETNASQSVSSDLQTVQFVLRDVSIQNVTFVVTAPEGVQSQLADVPDLPAETTTTEAPTDTTTTAEPTETTTETTTTETTTTTAETTTTTAAPTETTTAETTTETTTAAPTETTTTEEPTEATTTEAPTETTTTAEQTETTTEAPGKTTTTTAPSLRVSSLNAPGTIVLNEGTLVVNAHVRNPSEQVVTDTVQLRLNGSVVATQRVKVDPGETAQVQFRVDRTDLGLEPGEAFLGVLTSDFGKTITVTVREAPPEDGQEDDTTTAEA